MPHSCIICNKIINSGYLCQEHFEKLNFISKPNCPICCHPFDFEVSKNTLCPNCLRKKPSYEKAISIFAYDEISKKLIFDFKYHDKTNLIKFFTNILFNHSQEIIDDIDFISFVPLHKKRLKQRKYNQSALIARKFAKKSNITLITNLLIRHKNTKPQFYLSQKARHKNMAGAFVTNSKYLSEINNKNILLIDDVITTGATIENCCKELKKSGVSKIYILTIAKSILK